MGCLGIADTERLGCGREVGLDRTVIAQHLVMHGKRHRRRLSILVAPVVIAVVAMMLVGMMIGGVMIVLIVAMVVIVVVMALIVMIVVMPMVVIVSMVMIMRVVVIMVMPMILLLGTGSAFAGSGVLRTRLGWVAVGAAAIATPIVTPAASVTAATRLTAFLFVIVGVFLGGAQQRFPVGDRDAVIIRMDFAEGQEAVAIAAVFDETRL
jgi:hypothetical protein